MQQRAGLESELSPQQVQKPASTGGHCEEAEADCDAQGGKGCSQLGVKKNTSSYSYILTCSVVGSGYFSFFPLLLLLLILLLLLTLLKLFFKIYFLIEG